MNIIGREEIALTINVCCIGKIRLQKMGNKKWNAAKMKIEWEDNEKKWQEASSCYTRIFSTWKGVLEYGHSWIDFFQKCLKLKKAATSSR